jgi:hypothetical protein
MDLRGNNSTCNNTVSTILFSFLFPGVKLLRRKEMAWGSNMDAINILILWKVITYFMITRSKLLGQSSQLC